MDDDMLHHLVLEYNNLEQLVGLQCCHHARHSRSATVHSWQQNDNLQEEEEAKTALVIPRPQKEDGMFVLVLHTYDNGDGAQHPSPALSTSEQLRGC